MRTRRLPSRTRCPRRSCSYRCPSPRRIWLLTPRVSDNSYGQKEGGNSFFYSNPCGEKRRVNDMDSFNMANRNECSILGHLYENKFFWKYLIYVLNILEQIWLLWKFILNFIWLFFLQHDYFILLEYFCKRRKKYKILQNIKKNLKRYRSLWLLITINHNQKQNVLAFVKLLIFVIYINNKDNLSAVDLEYDIIVPEQGLCYIRVTRFFLYHNKFFM